MTMYHIDSEIRSVVLISDDVGLLPGLCSALGHQAETRKDLDSQNGWFGPARKEEEPQSCKDGETGYPGHNRLIS